MNTKPSKKFTKRSSAAHSKRFRHRISAASLALTVAFGVVAVGAQPASATSARDLPYLGSTTVFPSYLFSSTTLCVKNLGWNYGRARVVPMSPFTLGEGIGLNPGQTRCISRYWAGAPVWVTNVDRSPLRAWTY